jgi:hypothetical protein
MIIDQNTPVTVTFGTINCINFTSIVYDKVCKENCTKNTTLSAKSGVVAAGKGKGELE